MPISRRNPTPSKDLKMENPNGPFSSTPCFLVEVIGDSETGSELMLNADAHEPDIEVDFDNDDAESCSYDSSDQRILAAEEYKGWDGNDTRAAAVGISDAHELQADQFAAYQVGLFKQDLQIPAMEQKSCVSVDSTSPANELLNEMERSRRFWEACLASS